MDIASHPGGCRVATRTSPPTRMPPPRNAEQLQLALDAPRPSPADCDVCARCQGGDCKRWRELQRQWVEKWQGRAPPESGSWGDWWKQVKTHHKQLVAAALAAQAAPHAAPAEQAARADAAARAAGKRRASPDGTPNKGGQRKDAPATRELRDASLAA